MLQIPVLLPAGVGVDKGGQKDVPQAVDGHFVEITFGKVESETASEVFDSACEFISAKCGKRCGGPFKIFS